MFLATHTNAVDAKGRVSIPAPFRKQLSPREELILYRLSDQPVFHACTQAHFETLEPALLHSNLDASEREVMRFVLYAQAQYVSYDKEGRFSVPDDVRKTLGNPKQICFVGLGNEFQLWHPDQFAKHHTKLIALAKKPEFNPNALLAQALQTPGVKG